MSRSGWAYIKGDAPFSPRGPIRLLDTMWSGAGGPPELTREEIDAFALRSHQHAATARDAGRLAAEQLARLGPQPNTTQMTAGNSSPLSDGAGWSVEAGGQDASPSPQGPGRVLG
jgi:acetyl-CoA acetyltransferase